MEENRELLSADIEYNVLPLMYDIVKRNIGISIGKRALCEADATPAGTAGQGCISAKLPAMSTQSVQGFPFWKPLFMR